MLLEQRARAVQILLQTIAHVGNLAAIWSLTVYRGLGGEHLEAHVLVLIQAFHEFLAGCAQLAGMRQLGEDAGKTAHVFFQRRLRLQAQRHFGGFRLDVGVAVAVAANPGAEMQKAGYADVVIGKMIADARFQVGVNHRHRFEQAFLEIVQAVLDFISHLRA